MSRRVARVGHVRLRGERRERRSLPVDFWRLLLGEEFDELREIRLERGARGGSARPQVLDACGRAGGGGVAAEAVLPGVRRVVDTRYEDKIGDPGTADEVVAHRVARRGEVDRLGIVGIQHLLWEGNERDTGDVVVVHEVVRDEVVVTASNDD